MPADDRTMLRRDGAPVKAAVHYAPGDSPACGLPDVPAERLTPDLDAVTCGNCLSSRAWRMDISSRDYKADYERFHGPAGFSDRSGQTTPASATTAPQARAALRRVIDAELSRVAGMARRGAGDDIILAARRNAEEAITRQADNLICLALAETAEPNTENTDG
jgi:hypothetical protein